MLRRGNYGTLHKMSPQHRQQYVQEFAYSRVCSGRTR